MSDNPIQPDSLTPPIESATPRDEPRMPPPPADASSRELVLGWCLWLLGSWGITLWFQGVTQVRGMIYAAAAGMLLLWPAWRLSQGLVRDFRFPVWEWSREHESAAWQRRQLSGARPIARVLVDWFSLNLV